jgi:hypothetical protein
MFRRLWRWWTRADLVDAARARGWVEGRARWSEVPISDVDDTSPAAAMGFAVPDWLDVLTKGNGE